LHGSYLAIERLFKAWFKPADEVRSLPLKILIGAITYLAVLIAWVYFRAANFETANRLLGGMFGAHVRPDAILSTREILQVAIVTAGLLAAHWSMRETTIERVVTALPRWTVGAVWLLMAGAIILTQGNSNAFIYFQF
jgi:alginate O-acetyltransferase complex protein AlgI